ncbi:MAG: hypothetical protein WBB89_00815 [Candidatus Acidiferrum sp.]
MSGWRIELSALLWVSLFTLAVGCGHPVVVDVNASKGHSANEWIRYLPNSIDWSLWHDPLPDSLWAVIADSGEAEGEALLANTAAMPLTNAQLAKFLPGRTAKGIPFLVRGVSATWSTDGFEVKTSSRGELWVGCARLSRRKVPIQRRPVVVWLEEAPTEVYVTFGIYE